MKRYAIAGVGVVILLTVIGWVVRIGWNSNAWQIYLIKRELRGYGASRMGHSSDLRYRDGRVFDEEIWMEGAVALAEIGKAFAYAGDSQLALQIIGRVNDNFYKTYALAEVAGACVKLGDKGKANVLFLDIIKTAEQIENKTNKVYGLGTIAVSFGKLGEREKAISLLLQGVKVAEQPDDDIYLRRMALSYAELGEATKDIALLEEAVKIADQSGSIQIRGA